MGKLNLISSDESLKLSIEETKKFYREYINPGQVDQIGKFSFGQDLPVQSQGINIYMKSGKVIKDFTGGIGVLNHGHNHPRILEVRKKFNKNKSTEVHKNFFSPYLAALSHNLSIIFENKLRYSYMCNSGAESVEGALKMCYKYFKGKRNSVLSTDISFHGKLFLSGGISNSPEVSFKWPSPSNNISFKYNDINDFTEKINQNRNKLYAVIIEPFNSSSMEMFNKENLIQIRKLTKKYSIPLIFDEVYTGWFKTGYMFNFMRIPDLYPDILTTSKSFGGGKASIACFIAQDWIFKGAYGKLKDSIMHSTTYNGFGEETITALESINICFDEDYSSKSKLIHKKIFSNLTNLQKKYPNLIKEFNGSGALWGIIFNDKALNFAARKIIKSIKFSVFSDKNFLNKLIASAVIEEMYTKHNYLLYFGSNYRIPLKISTPINVELNEIDLFFKSLDNVLSSGVDKLILKFSKNVFRN